MRTNIDIDDDVLAAAMQSGAYKTKKEAVEAGLRLIARQEAYREILKWRGKLHWDGEAWADELPDSSAPAAPRPSEPPASAPARPRRGRR
jgi:hypothetical protein